MQLRLLSILMLIVLSSRVEAGCIDPATLVESTASITRYFDDEEKRALPGVLGMSGTSWFLSPTSMVTVEHVATSMRLSDRTWKQVGIRRGEAEQQVSVRVQHVVGADGEKIAVLELQTALSGSRGLQLRMEPLVPEEPVASLAYHDDRQRIAGGRFVQYAGGGRFAGTALLEMYDGDDRLALDYGSSGAPVLDCSGRVVAVVNKLFVTTIQFMSQVTRIPTAWGNPNVVSVPIQVLKGFSSVE